MKTLIKVILISLVLIIMSALMSGCKTVYVPVESLRTEYKDRLRHDSIYVKDSIYIREKGDTVFMDRWHTKYVEKLRVDSFCKIDSIQVPYPVEIPVQIEKKLSWWQNLKMETGGISLGILFVVLVYFAIKLSKSVKSVGLKAALKLIFKV